MLPARRALIVGNSDGIGLALTRRLLADGWTVVGLSRRPSPVQMAGYRHLVADVTATDHRAMLAGVADVRRAIRRLRLLRRNRRAVRRLTISRVKQKSSG